MTLPYTLLAVWLSIHVFLVHLIVPTYTMLIHTQKWESYIIIFLTLGQKMLVFINANILQMWITTVRIKAKYFAYQTDIMEHCDATDTILWKYMFAKWPLNMGTLFLSLSLCIPLGSQLHLPCLYVSMSQEQMEPRSHVCLPVYLCTGLQYH